MPKKERLGYVSLVVLILVSHQLHRVVEYSKDLTPMHSTMRTSSKNTPENSMDSLISGSSSNKTMTTQKIILKTDHPVLKTDDNLSIKRSNSKKTNEEKTNKSTRDYQVSKVEKKIIDPNKANLEELLSIGFTKYSSQNLIKYRTNGGAFRNVADLLKIYGMDATQLREIKPWVSFPEISKQDINQEAESRPKQPKKPKLSFDLNKVSGSELEALKGIGPVLSERIIAYRSSLGGFVDVDQLFDVYGLPEETIQSIRNQLYVKGNVLKIYPPAMSFKEVLAHPYIDYELTKLIKNLTLEEFESKMEAYIESGLIPQRLIPYLSLAEPLSE